MKTFLLLCFAGVLLCNSNLVISGATSGLILWYQSIVPVLMPFLIITYLIQNVYKGRHAWIKAVFLGLFCGFPIGAMVVSGQYTDNTLNENQAYDLLEFCCISSPAFILNYIYPFLHDEMSLFTYLLCIYLPVVIRFILYLLKHRNEFHKTCDVQSTFDGIGYLERAISNSCSSMLQIGAYIMFFSIIFELFYHYSLSLPSNCTYWIGFIELTNGIHYISSIPMNENLKTPLVLAINAFGGFSCLMQAGMYLTKAHLSIKKYMYRKIRFTILSLIIWYLMTHVF